VEPNFFGRLTKGGDAEIGVLGVLSSAWKPDLARPGITGALGTTDEQHAVRFGDQDHGDGRRKPTGGITLLRRPMGEEGSESLLK